MNPDDEVETLVAYAAEHRPSHFRVAQSIVDEEYKDTLTPFYNTKHGTESLWFHIHWQARNLYDGQPRLNALQLAALLGHERRVARMLQLTKLHWIDDIDDEGNTALI